MTSLTDRIRGIVAPGGKAAAEAALPPAVCAHDGLERVLAGEWRGREGARAFVVERHVEPDVVYGRFRVGQIARILSDAAGDAAMIARGAPAVPPFVFFDLETTGLAGGAGTHAFLIGCGTFDEAGAFVTRQYLLTRFCDERALLTAVHSELAAAGALISFNGKSFDAPLLETRFLFHRLEWTLGAAPHVDVLHPSRRLWPPNPIDAQVRGEAACSLGALEERILAAQRPNDVAGFEIPSRYFRFLRTGDERLLGPILEHNRNDLLALAGVTSQVLQLVQAGADAACDAHEAFALGQIYARAGLTDRAVAAFERALTLADRRHRHTRLDVVGFDRYMAVRVGALRALAVLDRRGRRHDDAARHWQALAELPGCPDRVVSEAMEALAIHHEHRVRDLGQAKVFALRSLEAGSTAARAEAGRHRLARIDRKLKVSARPPAFFSLSPPSSDSRRSARRTSS